MTATRPESPVVLGIDANRTLLNRYRYVLQESMRLLAGWLPRTATFELKCELGRTIWENSQHVNALYLRLREIQSPAFQRPDDPALLTLMTEVPHAPDEFALALGWFQVLVPGLVEALERHETTTFPNSDLPSVHAIHHILLDLRGQLARTRPLMGQAQADGRLSAAAREWESYVRDLLAAAGGISGLEPRPAGPAPAARSFSRPPRRRATPVSLSAAPSWRIGRRRRIARRTPLWNSSAIRPRCSRPKPSPLSCTRWTACRGSFSSIPPAISTMRCAIA